MYDSSYYKPGNDGLNPEFPSNPFGQSTLSDPTQGAGLFGAENVIPPQGIEDPGSIQDSDNTANTAFGNITIPV
jgi:hypothetical protein